MFNGLNEVEGEAIHKFLMHYAKDVQVETERIPVHMMTASMQIAGEQTVTLKLSMHALKKLVRLERIARDCIYDERIRHNNAAARLAWEHYQTLLALVE